MRLRLLSYLVIAYMLVAFSWWSVLLYVKNRDAFQAKSEYLQLVMAAENAVQNRQDFLQSPEYKDLQAKYKRQEWMIFGEAAVFIISLVIGVYMINRGYNKEMVAAQQRRNFLLSITHELKSPIASIRLVLETLLKRQLKKEQIVHFGQNALKETDRLNDLVNNLLLAAKIETAYQPHLEIIEINEFFKDLCARMQSKFPKAQIHFHSKLPDTYIRGDELALTSIGVNLIENGIKYNLENPIINIQLSTQAQKIILEFSDNGIGISEEEKKKIFQQFYRIGSEDTRKTKGTGLGLYIVAQMVKAFNGKISVLDNKPQGTLFRIEWPQEAPVAEVAVSQI